MTRLERAKRLWDRYGGVIGVSRDGRCEKCGMRTSGDTLGHFHLGDAMCHGKARGPWRYNAWVSGLHGDPGDFPWLAGDLAELRAEAKLEKKSAYRHVGGTRDK